MTLNDAITLVYATFHTKDMAITNIRDLILIALLASGIDKNDAHILANAFPHKN